MKRFLSILAALVLFSAGYSAVTTKVGGSGTTKVGGTGTVQVLDPITAPLPSDILAWWDGLVTSSFVTSGTVSFADSWTDRVAGYTMTASTLTRPTTLVVSGRRYLYFGIDSLISGTFTSGTFTDGELVLQTTTLATAWVNGAQSAGASLRVLNYLGPRGNTSSTWVGQTSGAVFTPTTLPAAQIPSRYMSLPAGFTVNRQARTIFVVQRRNAKTSDTQSLFHMGTASTTDAMYFTGQQVRGFNDSGSYVATGIFALDNVASFSTIGNTTDVLFALASQTSTNANQNTAGTISGGFLGAWNGPNFFQSGQDVLCVLVYNRALTTGERDTVDDFLSARYGATLRTNTKFIVNIGDSLTEGVETSNQRYYSYPDQIARLGSTQPKYANLGTGGANINPGSGAYIGTSTTTTQLSQNSGFATRTVTLWIGTNDIQNGRTAAQIRGDLASWVSTVQTADAGATLVGCTIIARGGWTAGQIAIQADVNDYIMARGAYSGAGLAVAFTVDLAANANLSDPTNATYFDPDQVHLNTTGQGVVASLIRAVYVTNSLVHSRSRIQVEGMVFNERRALPINTLNPYEDVTRVSLR